MEHIGVRREPTLALCAYIVHCTFCTWELTNERKLKQTYPQKRLLFCQDYCVLFLGTIK